MRAVIGVPMPHPARAEVVGALASTLTRPGPTLMAAGVIIAELGDDLALGEACTFEVQGHDPALGPAFAASGGAGGQAVAAAVADHGSVLYVIDDDAGSVASARRLLRLGWGAAEAGGLGVKVESSGRSHGPTAWAALAQAAEAGDRHALVDAFVVTVGQPHDAAYTCGLHHVGRPDVEVATDAELVGIGPLLDAFARFLVIDEPTLHAGETFSLGGGAPGFRLDHRPCTRFDVEDLFHNPFGVWHLLPL